MLNEVSSKIGVGKETDGYPYHLCKEEPVPLHKQQPDRASIEAILVFIFPVYIYNSSLSDTVAFGCNQQRPES